MSLRYQGNGNLQPGIHHLTLDKLTHEFGYNAHRARLIESIKFVCQCLKDCGCRQLFIDGSFASKKEFPADFDACYDTQGMDTAKLKSKYPIFFNFSNGRAAQKQVLRGEILPTVAPAKLSPYTTYLDFFQQDRNGDPKGIICILL